MRVGIPVAPHRRNHVDEPTRALKIGNRRGGSVRDVIKLVSAATSLTDDHAIEAITESLL